MLQSNKLNLQDFNLFWSKHTMEPPPSWTHWSDQFKLAKITEENMVNQEQEGEENIRNRPRKADQRKKEV